MLRGPLVRLPPHEHRESLVEVAAAHEGLVLVTAPPTVTTHSRRSWPRTSR
ncbi:hypothetical protein Q0F99_18350 [Rathayibacter oskolensis]|uniref:hypothetical protein n=1 Tax=Rathayibacter oskolensis TaxID=1891671 RepID=UPI00265FC977|nr:hypothetical protein [Rathayibacter oskolensis]WKK71358.1 hypothetical protein Q0F99_18350 [Rathayibacter oskolensis]